MADKNIWAERPLDSMWGLFSFFENEPSAKECLYKSYLLLVEEKKANRISYANTHKFIYFLKQGASYFKSAENSEVIVRPLLLYYGFTSLMKAIILLNDPDYPKSTSVLQHGITTRKKKKSNYKFLEDEVKVQKHGLLPHFSKVVIQSPLITHSKFAVVDLFSMLPELQDSFSLVLQQKNMIPLTVDKLNETSSWEFTFRETDLNAHGLSFSHIAHLFVHGLTSRETITSISENSLSIVLWADETYIPENKHTQILKDYRGNYYFYFSHSLSIRNEIIVYNMLMYILGMLCRYDTELWGDLLFSFSSRDMYLIQEFLKLSIRKFPNLILNDLFGEPIIFKT